MKIIGLTGSIGMGKSTAAAAFRRAGVPVFDADATVHVLQRPGGPAMRPIANTFPDAVTNGQLDRATLRRLVLADRAQMGKLEAILHPLVRAAQRRFIARARAAGARRVVLDIPLLFETHGDRLVDQIVVVSAPPAIQRARIRARRRMTEPEISAMIALQMPDSQKRRRADAIIRTGLSRHHAMRAIRRFLARQP